MVEMLPVAFVEFSEGAFFLFKIERCHGCLPFPLLIPDRVLLVVGMQLFQFLRVHVPEGSVDGPLRVFPFLVMAERAPPVFHYLHQIDSVPEECYTQRAIELAVEDPEEPVTRHMERGDIDDRLFPVSMAMGNPGGDEFPYDLISMPPTCFRCALINKTPTATNGMVVKIGR